MDANVLNEELSIVHEKLSSKLDCVLLEKVEVYNERDSLRSQLNLALKENEFLKSKNNCETILKKNEKLIFKN